MCEYLFDPFTFSVSVTMYTMPMHVILQLDTAYNHLGKRVHMSKLNYMTEYVYYVSKNYTCTG